jgi:acetyl esterase/lipase
MLAQARRPCFARGWATSSIPLTYQTPRRGETGWRRRHGEANGDNIKGIAPALVITAELDRLRDEAASYARKLEAAGSLVAYHDIPGVDHGYNILSDSEEVTRQMYDFIADHVANATAKRSS